MPDIEKIIDGLNLPKQILDKSESLLKTLFGPSLNEVGELLADSVKLRRLKNQIKIFSKAQEILKANHIDPKKVSTKKYIAENHKNVKFVSFDEKGAISLESLKSLLLKNQKNFVVLETANTYMIKTIMNTLVVSMGDYQIQLVILEPNEKLDSDEIVMANLAKLNLLYPSLARENDSTEAQIFERKYKEVNKVFPNQYATRGFDVTFDALLRLSQEKTFTETLETATTEQVENKFDYEKKNGKAYINDGFYILYFDTDLSVKVAN